MPYDEHSDKRLAGKRRWYREHQARVRAQQATYLAERNAWKWHSRNTQGLIGFNEGISVLNLRELQHPTYQLTRPLKPQWEPCNCKECTAARAAEKTAGRAG